MLLIYSYGYTPFLNNNKDFLTLLLHNIYVLGNFLMRSLKIIDFCHLQVLHEGIAYASFFIIL